MRNKWKGLKTIVVVESQSEAAGTGKSRKPQKRYSISSREADAGEFQKAIRLHCSIENKWHWVLDTAFREDHNQTYKNNAAKNLGTLRRIVLNILTAENSILKSIPKKRFEALMNISYREKLLHLT